MTELELDFFARSRPLKWAARWSALRVSIVLAVAILGVASIATWASGDFGSSADWRLIDDTNRAASRVLGGAVPSGESPSQFPLLRDYPSLVLAIVVAATAGAILCQWREFLTCLPDLVRAGVLVPRRTERFCGVSPVSTWLYQRIIGRTPASTVPLVWLVRRTNEGLARRMIDNVRLRAFSEWVLPVVVSMVFALPLVIGERRSMVFRVLAPGSVDSPEYTAWLEASYDSWWASVHNPVGVSVYFTIAAIGTYLVLIQNLAGVRAVILIASLPIVADFRMDWSNPDGQFGWSALTAAYRTVIRSLVIHAFALTLIVFVLGLGSAYWVLVFFVIWGGAFVTFTVIPIRTFTHVYERGCLRQSRQITAARRVAVLSSTAAQRVELDDWARTLHERVFKTRFHPLLRRRFDSQLLVFSFVVPLALTVVQLVVAS
jgi:hypothetical protein